MFEGIKRRRPKKFVFYETEDIYARFRTKLIFEGIKQSQFFRQIVMALIEDDKHIREWLDANPKCKVKKRTKTIRKSEDRKIQKEAENFNFDGINVDEIFDIIADEDKDD